MNDERNINQFQNCFCIKSKSKSKSKPKPKSKSKPKPNSMLNVKQRDQKLCFKLIDVLCKDVKCEAKRSKTIFQCFMSRCLMLSNKPSFDSYAEFALILYYKSAQLCTK